MGGWKGYLATITSQKESDFIVNNVRHTGLIGGTTVELVVLYHESSGAYFQPHVFADSTPLSPPYWACGPELIFRAPTTNQEWWSTKINPVTKKESKEGEYLSPDSTNFDNSALKLYPFTSSLSPSIGDSRKIGYLLNGSLRWESAGRDASWEIYSGGIMEFGDRLYGNSTPLDDSAVFTRKVVNSPEIKVSDWYNISTPTISVTGKPGSYAQIIDDSKDTILEASIGETGDVVFTMPKLSDGSHQFTGILVDQNGYVSEETSFTINIDTTIPYCEIKVMENLILDTLNAWTFNLFKRQVMLNIICSDSLSGIKEVYCFKSNSNISNYDLANNTDWESVDISSQESQVVGTVTVNSDDWNKDKFNESFFIYVKIQDNAGNCAYVKSDGVVVYKESTAITEEISFSGQPVSVAVNLNGNTINKIQRRDAETLSLGSDYKVSDTAITFNPTYLNTLDVGEYFFDIFYNPAGIVPENEENLHKTSLKINILKQTTDKTDVAEATVKLEEVSKDSELYKNSEEKLKEKFKGNIENTTIYKATAFDKDGNKIPNGTKLDEEFRIPLPYDFDKQKIYLLTSHLKRDNLKGSILKENASENNAGIYKEDDGYVLVIKGYYVGEYFTILTF
ncbi:MAG: Ig-like domain-containing protein [Oscillospiraceae bacterium]|nr:Ig-like domain-containing protein [Oscillospiraceae bacterium]